MTRRIENCCFIGAGYVGGPTAAILASKNPDIDVTVVDLSAARIAAWNSSSLPIYEPGLHDIVEIARDGSDLRRANLNFSTDVEDAILKADLIFISVNTPSKLAGMGAGAAADIKYLEAAARNIAEVATSEKCRKPHKIIVEKSTVPVGTADMLRDIFDAVGDSRVRFDILSNPEFLSEGTAMNDLLLPNRVLIGSEGTRDGLEAANALAMLYAAWVPRDRIITMSTWSSELSKLAANCMLAQRISSINSLSALCEATGANIDEVSRAVGLDDRLGPKFLKASVGFGGSCFKKDVLNLVYMAEQLHLPEVADYWNSVVRVNEWQKDRFSKRVMKALNNTVGGKRIACLGLAYKKDTGDTRESPAFTCIGQMLAEGADLTIYDPKVDYSRFLQELAMEHGKELVEKQITCCDNAYTACEGAAAVLILTEWDEFKTDRMPSQPVLDTSDRKLTDSTPKRSLRRSYSFGSSASSVCGDYSSSDGESHLAPGTPPTNVNSPAPLPVDLESTPTGKHGRRLDWPTIAKSMRRPRLLFDGRNVLEAAKLRPHGFVVYSIGKPDRTSALLR